MKRTIGPLLAVFFLACCGIETSPVQGQDKKEGVLVVIDGLQSRAPADWKDEEVTSKFRHKQFRLPKVKGDKDDAEIVIFREIGGSADANIDRWKKMFIPAEGKKLDDVAKITELKLGRLAAKRIDVAGTYVSKERPFDPQSKETRRAGFQLTGIQIDGNKAPYQIRFVGPAATVEHYRKGFEDWVKAFK